MVNLTIDGRPAQVPEGTTILEAARQADIHIPHLCYLKGINEIAACRVCCVEVEGERAMVTACNNPVQEGMAVHTNSSRAQSQSVAGGETAAIGTVIDVQFSTVVEDGYAGLD